MESTDDISCKQDLPIIIPHNISPTTAGMGILIALLIHDVNIGIRNARQDTNKRGYKFVVSQ